MKKGKTDQTGGPEGGKTSFYHCQRVQTIATNSATTDPGTT